VWRTVFVVLIAASLALGACERSTPSPPSQSDLAAEGEASLKMAGSTELARGGREASSTLNGPVPSAAWRDYGTSSSWEDVVSYFDAELRARGWAAGGGSSGVLYDFDEEFGVIAWHKGDRILRLGHRRFVTNDTIGFPTYYEVRVVGRGPTCCASATPSP
jgi:hypothetical protein